MEIAFGVIGFLILYLVIRVAVKHGITDALEELEKNKKEKSDTDEDESK